MRRDAVLPFAIAGMFAQVLLGPQLPRVQAAEKGDEARRMTSFPHDKVPIVKPAADFTVQYTKYLPSTEK